MKKPDQEPGFLKKKLIDELDKRYPCIICGHECGPDDIHGCETLRCPKCGTVFEPKESDQ